MNVASSAEIPYIDELVDVFDVDLVPADASYEVHQTELRAKPQYLDDEWYWRRCTYRSDHSIVSKLLAFGQVADAQEKFQEDINRIQEMSDASTELFVNVG